MQPVAGIQEDDIVSGGMFQSLVHRVVKSFVRFADDPDVMRACFARIGIHVPMNQFHGLVFGTSVDNQMFDMGESLGCHAFQGAWQCLFRIVGDCGNGDGRERNFVHVFCVSWVYLFSDARL